jgi:hypothetical protein
MNACVPVRGDSKKQESCLVDILMDWLAIPFYRKIQQRSRRTVPTWSGRLFKRQASVLGSGWIARKREARGFSEASPLLRLYNRPPGNNEVVNTWAWCCRKSN